MLSCSMMRCSLGRSFLEKFFHMREDFSKERSKSETIFCCRGGWKRGTKQGGKKRKKIIYNEKKGWLLTVSSEAPSVSFLPNSLFIHASFVLSLLALAPAPEVIMPGTTRGIFFRNTSNRQ